MVELRKITEDNFEQCILLHPGNINSQFIGTVEYSLAEAWLYYDDMRLFAVYDDDTLIGFVSMYVGEQNYQIINFFISKNFQNKGFGRQAFQCCMLYLQQEFNAQRISIPVHIRHKGAQKFWAKQGFIMTDTIESEYVFMRKFLL